MNKPLIGISGSVLEDQGGMFPGYERAYVNRDYCEAVLANGGVPFILPVINREEVVKQQVEQMDALILSGGHDVSPFRYGKEPRQKLGDTFPERDEFDFTLIKFAMEKGIPILGICRGFHVLNVYFGGSLYQDLSYVDTGREVVKHWQEHNPTLPTHTVHIEKNTHLSAVLKEESLLVNSFHHQCLENIGTGLRVAARASDGVVEGIEKEDYPFLLGVQWHPEMLAAQDSKMAGIFAKLIEEAKG